MARSDIELDFFSMKNESNGISAPAKPPTFERRRSFRDIQGIISKMNPEVVKSVIENGSLKNSSLNYIPSASKETDNQQNNPPLPACDPTLRLSYGYENNPANTVPMTIFYDGMVAVFDLPPHKAQNILRVAEDRRTSTEDSESNSHISASLNGDFPITRKKSIQRFLEKRKESLGRVSC